MRLAAIFNVWDDWDMLFYSVKNIRPLVEGVIIIGSEYSNFGEFSSIPSCWIDQELYIREPQFKNNPRASETDKRNYGLDIARRLGYTHFISMDADEFYEPEQFLKSKEFFKNPDVKGLVCTCTTYFKSPKLTIGLDSTLVPFIHQLTPHIRHGFNKNYPFAWDGPQIRIDPTRSLNIQSGVERTDLVMSHLSWVRTDYNKKIRNSTARANLERSSILKDLKNAKGGYFCEYYQKTLMECENKFNIPEELGIDKTLV